MRLYKARPVTVQVVEWNGKNHDEIRDFLGYVPAHSEFFGYYVVKGSAGRPTFYTPDEFHAAFEPLLPL